MKRLKMILSMLVIICLLSTFAVNSFAVEKKSEEKSGKSGLININTAGTEQLVKLPRIGPKMAERIVDHRKKHGKFKKIQDLMKVSGIGEKTFKGLEDMVTI